MTFDQFLRIIRARWKLAAGIFLLVVASAVIGSLVFPKKYAATTTVIIDNRPDPVSGPQTTANSSSIAFLATQLDVIQSSLVAQRVVRELNLGESPTLRANWVKDTKERGDYQAWVADLIGKGLKVRPSRDSNVIEIEYEGSDPGFAASMANAFAKAYIDTTVQFRVSPARQYSDFFEERAKLAREKLERAQQKLAAAQKERGIIATEERLDVEMLRLTELSQQVNALRAMRSDAQNRSLESRRNPELSGEVMTSQLMGSLKGDLARQEGRLLELLQRYSDAHPGVIEVRTTIANLRKQIRDETGRMSGALGSSLSVVAQREKEAITAYEDQKDKLMKLKESRSELAVLDREVDSAQRIYEAIMARLSQTNLEGSTSQAGIMVLSPASEPTDHSSPKLLLNTIIGLVLGILLALMAALGFELVDRRIRSADDLVQLLDVAVIGSLPGPEGKKPKLLSRFSKSSSGPTPPRPALA